ncbi:MAG: DUF4089 domain-containing protein [Beijerinckiaceae bacterium]|nr:DUF4089 domain-containing protein [Beijerinckiaceae bacterium]
MNEASKNVIADAGAYVDTASALIGLPIPEASKPIVVANLEVAMRMAALLDGFELDDREEPAPVFRP